MASKLRPVEHLHNRAYLYAWDPVTEAIIQLAGDPTTGNLFVDLRRALTISFVSIDVASSGDNTIVAADTTRKIKVSSYVFVADAAVTARWKSGAGTNLSGAMSLAASGGVAASMQAPAGGHWFETAVNQALVLNLGGAVGVRGHLSYFLEV